MRVARFHVASTKTSIVIKHKVGLLTLAQELGNISIACQVIGLSRDTFYRYKSDSKGDIGSVNPTG